MNVEQKTVVVAIDCDENGLVQIVYDEQGKELAVQPIDLYQAFIQTANTWVVGNNELFAEDKQYLIDLATALISQLHQVIAEVARMETANFDSVFTP